VLANKAYSSWSLRPWILLAHFKIPFEEVTIRCDQPDTRAQILRLTRRTASVPLRCMTAPRIRGPSGSRGES